VNNLRWLVMALALAGAFGWGVLAAAHAKDWIRRREHYDLVSAAVALSVAAAAAIMGFAATVWLGAEFLRRGGRWTP